MESDKKQRIMQAAERLFKTRQLHEITLDEVAREADVGKGTLYLYFADKEDLFFQTALSGFDELCDMLATEPPAGTSFKDALLGIVRRISDFFLQRRPLFRLILAEGDRALGRGGSLRQRWLERRRKLTGAMSTVIGRGVATGEIRDDLPAEVIAEYLLAMLRARALELEHLPEAARTHAGIVDLLIHGAAPARGKRFEGGLEPVVESVSQSKAIPIAIPIPTTSSKRISPRSRKK